MEKIIVIAPRKEFDIIRFLISGMAQRVVDVLLVDPKESPDYEEIVREANAKLVCTLDDSNIEDELKKSIEEFNRDLELKNVPRVLDWIDTNKLFDNTPWYDRFLSKLKKIIIGEINLGLKRKGNNIWTSITW